MKEKHIYAMGVVLFLLGILAGMAFLYTILGSGNVMYSSPVFGGTGTACPALAKLCPDGSTVSPTGPNCTIPECPLGETSTPTPTPSPVGSGSQCVNDTDCPSGYECIDPSPIVREGTPTNLRCWKIGMPHPICLSGETKISTPFGDILVKDLREKMVVWTTDKNGKKVEGTIISIGRTLAPKNHKVVHLVLTDGGELFISPGHKAADGRAAGDLQVGDSLQGSVIKTADLIPYTEKYTYDILPDGDTGTYYAGGILLQSTLSR